ncbi:hypothetical protein [Henriciella sp.]|uniref:hypothetical protein n=1 Tax=Henriciella sp. TaxID=1968823 RepID=UPI00262394F1|nr:hypothetical protein [Henriciella sp.]
MQYHEVSKRNWEEAVSLLCEGFPERNADFWNAGLQRWSKVVGDPFAGPVGILTCDEDGKAQGVLLTFRAPEMWSSHQQINFSSWYVRKKYRAFAPIILKRLSNDETKTFTDFTPNKPVQQMLRGLGYTEYCLRQLGYWTPVQALKKGAPALQKAETMPHVSSDPRLMRALDDHSKLGCIVLGIQTRSAVSPIVLRPKTRKRAVKSAEIIYCPDVALIAANLPGISRQLLRRGILVLETTVPVSMESPASFFDWGEASAFVKGQWQACQINQLYSEIPVLGI